MSFEILNRFRPVVYLHSKEQYFPLDMENYLANSTLKVPNLPDVEAPTPQIMTDSQHNTLNSVLDIKESAWRGVESKNLNSVPFYARLYEDETFYYALYFFIYAYNGNYDICGMKCLTSLLNTAFPSLDTGAHQSDVEHVTLKIKKNTQEITSIFYSAHSSNQGTWVDRKDIEFEFEHPVVYSAKGSHACYNKEGFYPRIFFTANDVTNKGYRWAPTIEEISENNPLWNAYIGRIGAPAEGRMPSQKGYWNKEVDEHATWWFRLFCCCKF